MNWSSRLLAGILGFLWTLWLVSTYGMSAVIIVAALAGGLVSGLVVWVLLLFIGYLSSANSEQSES